jgi:hypothetical protein
MSDDSLQIYLQLTDDMLDECIDPRLLCQVQNALDFTEFDKDPIKSQADFISLGL